MTATQREHSAKYPATASAIDTQPRTALASPFCSSPSAYLEPRPCQVHYAPSPTKTPIPRHHMTPGTTIPCSLLESTTMPSPCKGVDNALGAEIMSRPLVTLTNQPALSERWGSVIGPTNPAEGWDRYGRLDT